MTSIQDRIRKLQEAMKGGNSSQGNNLAQSQQTIVNPPQPAWKPPIQTAQQPQPIKKVESTVSQPTPKEPEPSLLSIAERKRILQEMAKKNADQPAKKEVMPLKQNNSVRTEEKPQLKEPQKQITANNQQHKESEQKKSVPEPVMKKIQSNLTGVSDISEKVEPQPPNQLKKTMSYPIQNTNPPTQNSKQEKLEEQKGIALDHKTNVQQRAKNMRMLMTAPPPRAAQQTQAVVNQSQQFQKQAAHILNRGVNVKKNKKRQDVSFDDL